MRLKSPWWDFLFLVCITDLGVVGIQGGKGWMPLWWAMALSGGIGFILWWVMLSKQDGEELIKHLDEKKDSEDSVQVDDLGRGRP